MCVQFHYYSYYLSPCFIYPVYVHMWRAEDNLQKSVLSTTWILIIKLRSPSWVANASSRWVISLAPCSYLRLWVGLSFSFPLYTSLYFFALCELSSAFPGKWEMSYRAIEVNQFDNVGRLLCPSLSFFWFRDFHYEISLEVVFGTWKYYKNAAKIVSPSFPFSPPF